MAIQPILYPPNSPSIKPISLLFRGKNVVGDHIKALTEVQPLLHRLGLELELLQVQTLGSTYLTPDFLYLLPASGTEGWGMGVAGRTPHALPLLQRGVPPTRDSPPRTSPT
ncbi:hypothetical protein QYF61_011411 [Mycteria americana]|uniref:Uncharacterized protein n=1 Tax=Mycteria americana TaxID=33587 RepID=A0AAN7PSE3_MYCAM|nr:hypothetical protein QYF61_011411 [Mycteria americana]